MNVNKDMMGVMDNGDYVAEASTMGQPPGVIPNSIIVEDGTGHEKYEIFKYSFTEYSDTGYDKEVLGWVYCSLNRKLTVLND